MTPGWKQPPYRLIVAVVAAVAALFGAVAGIVIDDGDPGTPAKTIRLADTRLPVTPAPAEFDAGAPGGVPLAKSHDIPGVPERVEQAIEQENAEAVDDGTYDTSGVLKGATAEPARFQCHTNMHGAARPLSAVGLGVVHVTVSSNVPGLRDIDSRGLCGFFRRVKASPTWTVDNEGNSTENVPLRFTPWTQAWYNRSSCSIEFVGSTGRRGEGAAQWTDVQLREGARLMAKCFKLAGIPVRQGAVTAGGRIVKTGIRTHQQLLSLGGGHTDPGPFFNMARFQGYVRTYALAGSPKPVTATDTATCRKLNWWRTHGRPHGLAERRAVRRKAALTSRKVTCTSRGPRRT